MKTAHVGKREELMFFFSFGIYLGDFLSDTLRDRFFYLRDLLGYSTILSNIYIIVFKVNTPFLPATIYQNVISFLLSCDTLVDLRVVL